uniref:Uncharacterized protein n=1 Tax=Coccidioides posadasii RMSCC 3488 TaxID=454284 RepID=A0A0J6F890_COCPO|nr:hypothetical protein CPAG_01491 [Coccidioides posadasii RMSCC 3488]
MRAGSRGRLIAIPSFFGIMCQLCIFGVGMPIYVTLHLFTSPASFNPNRENTDFPFFRVNTFLWSISNGYILPTILIAFPNMSKRAAAFKTARDCLLATLAHIYILNSICAKQILYHLLLFWPSEQQHHVPANKNSKWFTPDICFRILLRGYSPPCLLDYIVGCLGVPNTL